jgi:hypothetical protein
MAATVSVTMPQDAASRLYDFLWDQLKRADEQEQAEFGPAIDALEASLGIRPEDRLAATKWAPDDDERNPWDPA